MNYRINEICTQLIIVMTTIMLVLSGILGIETTKYCLYVIVALCYVKAIYVKIQPLQLILFLIIFIVSFIVVITNNGVFASWIIFISSLIFAIDLFRFGIDKSTWKLLKFCSYIICIAFIGYAIFDPNLSHYDQLTLYFDNPNMTGIAISAPTILIVLMVAENKGKLLNVFNWILLLVMMFLIYLTQNRGSVFSVLLLIIVTVFSIYPKKTRKICAPWVWKVLKFIPIFVMFIYIGMYFALPESLEFLGKPLFSGREGAWVSALIKIFITPFSYHRFEEGTLNLFLEGAARYGIVSIVCYFVLLMSFGKKKEEMKKLSMTSYLAYVAFHCCLIQQSFESTMLTGSYSVYVLTYILLGVASMKIRNNDSEKELEGI